MLKQRFKELSIYADSSTIYPPACMAAAGAYLAANPEAGAGDRSGTVPRIATIGYAGQSGTEIAPEVGAYKVTPVRSGQRRCGYTVVKKS